MSRFAMSRFAMSRFPFEGHPRGWYVVARSDELEAGAAIARRYFDRELVLFRGAAGSVGLLDGFCPHLGAHLGRGGRVEGNTLRCPFHGWRFDGAGGCVEVPFAEKIPPKARARSYPVRELSGLILAWYDPAGGVEPAFPPPALPELGSAEWLPVVCKEWTVRTHLADTNENNCDRAHLCYVHGLAQVRSSARPEGPVLHVVHEFETDMARLGLPGTAVAGTVEGTHTGLGILTQRIRALVEGLLVSTQTPIDEQTVHLRFTFTVRIAPDEAIARLAAEAMWADLVRDVEDDIRIWEHKAYLEQPVLSDADGPIGLYRRWSRQFFADGRVERP